MTRVQADQLKTCRICHTPYISQHCPHCPTSKRNKRQEAIRERGRGICFVERQIQALTPIEGRIPYQEDRLTWYVRFSVPLIPAAHSKNKAHTLMIKEQRQGDGSVKRVPSRYSPTIAKDARIEIAISSRLALHEQQITPVQAKLWVDVLVLKENPRFDAANVIDTVLDGIRDGIGLDDRFYAIRFLDWDVVMEAPELIIGFGQTTRFDHDFCQACGRMFPLALLEKVAGMKHVCTVCRNDSIDRRAS